MRKEIEKNFPGRHLTIGRVAHLTEPLNGRGTCQFRNRCSRGCPYGAYFSSNAVTLPAAEKTGNYTIRPHSMVHSILYDEQTNRAKGVVVIDTETKQTTEYFARVVFCCASTIASTQILLNSTSRRFPTGLGNDSGELGHNLMDHHYRVDAGGIYDGFEDQYYKGRRPTGIFIPRFVNLDAKTRNPKFLRGYDYQGGGAGRGDWSRGINQEGVGASFKDALFKPGGFGA